MKAVILAAGFGRGIKPLSEVTPKPLVQIANRSIIEHLILNFQKANISEVIVVIGYLKEQMEEFFEQLKMPSMEIRLVYAKNFERGPIYSFYSVKSMNLKDDFLLTPSDLFIDPYIISNLIRYHKKGSISVAIDSSKGTSKGTQVFTYSESRLNLQNKNLNYGKVSGFKNRILNKSGSSTLAIPLLICSPVIFNYVENAIEQNDMFVYSALNVYIKELNPLNYFDFSSYYWFDIDNLGDILLANRFALHNNIVPKNHIHFIKGRKMGDLTLSEKEFFNPTSEIIPPVLVGENCYAKENSKIGPYVSINNNSGLEADSKIENAIIYGNSQVPENSKIQNAIIYKNKIINVNLSQFH